MLVDKPAMTKKRSKKRSRKPRVDPSLVTDPKIIEAAESLARSASSILASSFGTFEIHLEVGSVYWTDEEAAGEKAESDTNGKASPTRNIHVSWVSWEHDGKYAGDPFNGLKASSDQVVVGLDDLLSGDAATYGLGPEFSFMSADTSSKPTDNPPEEVIDYLASNLDTEWNHDFVEWSYDNWEATKAKVAKWPTKLRKVAERLIAEHEHETD